MCFARWGCTSRLPSSLATVNTGMVKLYASHHSGFEVISLTLHHKHLSPLLLLSLFTHLSLSSQDPPQCCKFSFLSRFARVSGATPKEHTLKVTPVSGVCMY